MTHDTRYKIHDTRFMIHDTRYMIWDTCTTIQGTTLDPHLICKSEGVDVHPAVSEQPETVCAQLEVSAGDVD